jgi:hypothetical protein
VFFLLGLVFVFGFFQGLNFFQPIGLNLVDLKFEMVRLNWSGVEVGILTTLRQRCEGEEPNRATSDWPMKKIVNVCYLRREVYSAL